MYTLALNYNQVEQCTQLQNLNNFLEEDGVKQK